MKSHHIAFQLFPASSNLSFPGFFVHQNHYPRYNRFRYIQLSGQVYPLGWSVLWDLCNFEIPHGHSHLPLKYRP